MLLLKRLLHSGFQAEGIARSWQRGKELQIYFFFFLRKLFVQSVVGHGFLLFLSFFRMRSPAQLEHWPMQVGITEKVFAKCERFQAFIEVIIPLVLLQIK